MTIARNKRYSVLILLLMLLAGLTAGCKSESTQTQPILGTTVGINDAICPSVIIQVGEKLTWTNDGKQEHMVRDVTSGSASQFDSGILGPGNSFSFVFPAAKTYTYTCSADGSMTGTITVNPKP